MGQDYIAPYRPRKNLLYSTSNGISSGFKQDNHIICSMFLKDHLDSCESGSREVRWKELSTADVQARDNRLDQRSADFSLKGQTVDVLGLRAIQGSLLQLLNSDLCNMKTTTQWVNEWVWLCPSKALFIK